MELGEQKWREGDYHHSLEHLEEVLKESQASYPEDTNDKARVYSMMGSSCLRMNMFDKAADYYTKSLSLLALEP